MNKFICTTLAFSMLLTSAVFADGQTLTNKRNYSFGSNVQAVQDAKYPVQDLTVDDAVTKAIANSNTIKTLKESKELAEDSQDDLTFAFSYTQDYATNLSLTVQMKRLQVALQQYDENTELAKQTIDYSVQFIFWNCPFEWSLAMLFIYRGTIQGLKNGIVPMIGSLIEVVMRIMTPVIFSSVIGYASICVAGPAAWTGSMLLMIAVYYVKIRKLSKTKTVVAN